MSQSQFTNTAPQVSKKNINLLRPIPPDSWKQMSRGGLVLPGPPPLLQNRSHWQKQICSTRMNEIQQINKPSKKNGGPLFWKRTAISWCFLIHVTHNGPLGPCLQHPSSPPQRRSHATALGFRLVWLRWRSTVEELCHGREAAGSEIGLASGDIWGVRGAF